MNIITFTSCPVDSNPGQRTHTKPLTAAETGEFRAVAERVGYTDLMAYPVFSGELYSYTDAQKRAPHAWQTTEVELSYRRQEYDKQLGKWIELPGYATREDTKCIAEPGLGHFERRADGKWIWIAPNGVAHPVSDHCDMATPPPLPRPASERRSCNCGQRHHDCGSCGESAWVEIHGMADGYCTHCYSRG